MNSIAISEIQIGARHRKDFGDLQTLSDSIYKLGLLQPIGVTSDKRLVFGHRRIKACELLDWEEIPCRIVDIERIVDGEYAENEVRKDFTVSERLAIARAVEREIGNRQGQRTDVKPETLQDNSPEVEVPAGIQTREVAAKKAGFGSTFTYEQAKKVEEKGAPELIAAVDSGRVAVSTAAAIAEAPKEEQHRIVSLPISEIPKAAREIKKVRAKKRVQDRADKQAAAIAENHPLEGARFRVMGCAVENLIDELSGELVDAVITDPPYPADFLPTLSALSLLAQKVLKPGGHCLVMYGQANLREAMERLGEHLSYQWTLAYLTPGQSTQVFGRKVKSNWKPVLWYVNGKNSWEHVEDTVKSSENDKRFHEWGQSVSGMAAIIERFTVKGALILDPFMGAGTTGIAALKTGRLFLGADVDPGRVAQAAQRLAQAG